MAPKSRLRPGQVVGSDVHRKRQVVIRVGDPPVAEHGVEVERSQARSLGQARRQHNR